MEDIPQKEWDRLADPIPNPFLEWEFLRQLERSGSIAPETGWYPRHLLVRENDILIAAAPLYIKMHSMGEFVFDFAWADVAQQLGVRYYPKLVGTVPATPSVGYRFLTDPDGDTRALTRFMLEEIHAFCRDAELGGVSFLFTDSHWQHMIAHEGFVGWKHQSYLWRNPGYRTFDDYLAEFRKNQRRNIRRERASMEEQGITMRALHGDEIPRHYFSLMYEYYENTNEQFGPWAAKFLNREFFTGLYEGYRHRLVFAAAYRQGQEDPIALSFLVVKDRRMIGRYWGSQGYYDNLHFNACYYTPIEWAINNGIEEFDPGMGSPHKIRRGFMAMENFSLHHFYDKRMQMIMQGNISKINAYEQANIDELNAGLPFANREDPRESEGA